MCFRFMKYLEEKFSCLGHSSSVDDSSGEHSASQEDGSYYSSQLGDSCSEKEDSFRSYSDDEESQGEDVVESTGREGTRSSSYEESSSKISESLSSIANAEALSHTRLPKLNATKQRREQNKKHVTIGKQMGHRQTKTNEKLLQVDDRKKIAKKDATKVRSVKESQIDRKENRRRIKPENRKSTPEIIAKEKKNSKVLPVVNKEDKKIRNIEHQSKKSTVNRSPSKRESAKKKEGGHKSTISSKTENKDESRINKSIGKKPAMILEKNRSQEKRRPNQPIFSKSRQTSTRQRIPSFTSKSIKKRSSANLVAKQRLPTRPGILKKR